MKKFSLPKKKRLVSNNDFKSVLTHGRSARNSLLILYIARNDCGYPRLGVSVGKSYGNAVVRNRTKRLLREVFRQCQDRIYVEYDYLVMISRSKEPKRRPTFEQVKKSFLTLVNTLLSDSISSNK